MSLKTVGKVRMFGRRDLGNTKRIPDDMLNESVIGAKYVLKIQTGGVSNPDEAIRALSKGLKEKLNVNVLYGEVSGDTITLQIEGLQFAWTTLIGFLPQILSALGIVIGLTVVYLFSSSIPTWVYGLGFLSLAMIYVAPKISGIMKAKV